MILSIMFQQPELFCHGTVLPAYDITKASAPHAIANRQTDATIPRAAQDGDTSNVAIVSNRRAGGCFQSFSSSTVAMQLLSHNRLLPDLLLSGLAAEPVSLSFFLLMSLPRRPMACSRGRTKGGLAGVEIGKDFRRTKHRGLSLWPACRSCC
jgi:hypothetical protein